MSAKIFVGNLDPRTTRADLERFFAAAGTVVGVRIPSDRQSGQPRGFAFVEFGDRESAEEALSSYDGEELAGRELRLSWAREEESDRRSRRSRDRRDRSGRGVGVDGEELDRGRWRSDGEDDYDQGRKLRRHGKHGSDRKRRHGTRRVIE